MVNVRRKQDCLLFELWVAAPQHPEHIPGCGFSGRITGGARLLWLEWHCLNVAATLGGRLDPVLPELAGHVGGSDKFVARPAATTVESVCGEKFFMRANAGSAGVFLDAGLVGGI